MSTFALSVSDTPEDVIGALNYALSNLGSTVTGNITYSGNILVANTTTGVISSVTNTGATQVPVISYLYGYVNVKYANSASGSSGFTSNSAYANYYGVHNTTDGSISSNPTDYNWTQVSGGFGATKQLYYTTGGGNTVNFNVSAGVPSIYYTPVLDNIPIQLAIISNSAVVANSIQPRVITNVQIASNTIQGQNIQLGTITANLLAVGTIIVSNSIQSNNAIFGNYQSPGYWLDSTTGNVRFGGNASVGNNLTVGNNAVIGGNITIGGLVTAGNIIANVVATSALQAQAATTVVNVVGEQGVTAVTFVNGNTSVYGQTGYLWPTNTRGFGSSGATIIPTTNGSPVGSQITVNWNTFINTLQYSEYNLVELWKNGQSNYYQNNFQRITCAAQLLQSGYNAYDIYTAVGNNGSVIGYRYPSPTSSTGGWTIPPPQANTAVLITSGVTSTLYSQTSYLLASAVGWNANYILNDIDTNIPFFTYGAVHMTDYVYYPGGGNFYAGYNTVVVGAGGQIMRIRYAASSSLAYSPLVATGSPAYVAETSPVIADLYDVNIGSSPSTLTGILTVAVGTGGTIITTTRNYTSSGSPTQVPLFSSQTGWTQQASNTYFNLYSVCSDWQGGLSKWVAVGDQGTIVTAGASASGWTVQTSGTTANLYGVAYSNGYWTVVGAGGIILRSSDTITWTTVTSPFPGRDLYDICCGQTNPNELMACGQEVLIKSANSGSTWANVYTGGNSLASNLTRLQYYGSWANIATTTLPPAEQRITNGQVISGSFTDSNYVAGNPLIYYVVLGSLTGNTTVYSAQTSITVTEFKR